jgi:hypothetical protein
MLHSRIRFQVGHSPGLEAISKIISATRGIVRENKGDDAITNDADDSVHLVGVALLQLIPPWRQQNRQ